MLAVAVTLACPEALVATDVAPSAAEAPAEEGAAKVTVTFWRANEVESRTTTKSGAAKAPWTTALWLPPLTTVIVLGAPRLRRAKLATTVVPLMVAVTL